MGPYPPEKTPNHCGGCGTNGINECGSCTGSPNEIVKGCDGVCGSKATVGCDGICNSGKVVSGCDNQCGSTKRADQCGICGGNGSTCDCVWAVGIADCSGIGCDAKNTNARDLNEIYDQLQFKEKRQLPTCLSNFAKNHCHSYSDWYDKNIANDPFFNTEYKKLMRRRQDKSTQYWGACSIPWTGPPSWSYPGGGVSCTAPIPAGDACLIEELGRRFKVPQEKLYDMYLPKAAVTDSITARYNPAVWWYVDSNCNYIQGDRNTKVCGFQGVAISPISLDFSEGTIEDVSLNIVKFQLSPDSERPYVIWQGSKTKPILVYNYDNSNVTYRKMFGNHFESPNGKTEWKNGYEALKSLDTNDSGNIEGDELDKLSLWFDNNQDAVASSDEMKGVKDLGITKLFFKDYASDQYTEDLRLQVGYERTIEGKSVFGSTVDWYSEVFESHGEAVMAMSDIVKKYTSQNVTMHSPTDTTRENSRASLSEHPRSNDDISGTWMWTMHDGGGKLSPGMFIISKKSDGSFTIKSITESNVAKSENHSYRSAYIAVNGQGETLENGDNPPIVKFEITDNTNGLTSTSEGRLVDNGKKIVGITKQKYEFQIGSKSVNGNADYAWIATRVELKK